MKKVKTTVLNPPSTTDDEDKAIKRSEDLNTQLESIVKDKTIGEIVSEGLLYTETALFSQCEIVFRRIVRLSNIIETIEDKLSDPDLLKDMDSGELLTYYQTYSRVQGDLTKHLKDIHHLALDTTKFSMVQDLIKAKEPEIIEAEEDNVMIKELLHIVDSEIRNRSEDQPTEENTNE